MNILAVGAHPDDIELLCGGTLLLYAQAGHSLWICPFTDGSMGDLDTKPDPLAATRQAEAQAAADRLGATLIWPGIRDEHVVPDLTQRRVMIDVLRQADPDIILTHDPADYHPDHRGVAQLVFDSFFQKGLPHIPDQQEPACRFGQCALYYMDTVAGIDFSPNEHVDISAVMDAKRELIACHQSQLVAIDAMTATSLENLLEVQSRFRGLAAGCRYAEAFRRCDAFQRGQARRILP